MFPWVVGLFLEEGLLRTKAMFLGSWYFDFEKVNSFCHQVRLGLGRVPPPCYDFIPVFAHSLRILKYLSLNLVLPSLHDSGGNLWSSEQMDLQVDYWLVGGNRKDINKVGNPQEIMKNVQNSYLLKRHTYFWLYVKLINSYLLTRRTC